jgi:phosphatidylserine/phosphatidylglycerophosphate/cardiolipin synthase-like enzyme
MKLMTILFAILIVTFWIVLSPLPTLPQEKPSTRNWEAYFSPHGGATDAIIRELNKARSTILVQVYLFSSEPIAKALLNAHKRGVKVEVILNKSQRTDKYSPATFFFNAGIPVKIDAAHAIAHIKLNGY